MLTEVVKPKNKSELIKRINSLKNIDVKVIEPVTRNNSRELKQEVDRFISSSGDVSIIMIKQK
jgi:t-SNARE complex subunit (syntaxin)